MNEDAIEADAPAGATNPNLSSMHDFHKSCSIYIFDFKSFEITRSGQTSGLVGRWYSTTPATQARNWIKCYYLSVVQTYCARYRNGWLRRNPKYENLGN